MQKLQKKILMISLLILTPLCLFVFTHPEFIIKLRDEFTNTVTPWYAYERMEKAIIDHIYPNSDGFEESTFGKQIYFDYGYTMKEGTDYFGTEIDGNVMKATYMVKGQCYIVTYLSGLQDSVEIEIMQSNESNPSNIIEPLQP